MSSQEANMDALVQAAQREILETYRKEADQLASAFRDLDGKAQGTATIAGGFLVASLAFLNRGQNLDEPLVRGILIIGTLGLVCAIVFSLMALRIRTLIASPSGEDIRALIRKLASETDEQIRAERFKYFYGDASDLWIGFVEDRRKVIEEKAEHVWSAQKSLLITALGVLLVLVLIILNE